MDPRCIPERIFNLDAGEVAVHRNAGGNIRDALRDINILDTLVKLKEILIIHHTDCGTLHVTEEQIRAHLKTYVDEDNWDDITKMNFGANTNIEESVRGDLEWFRANPLVREELKQGCQGFVYDIKTGELKKVETV
ncbi:carbonic anhydrase [Ilyonectria destructans]|nr:carbonic anhydrase [Ilyonectria destructans]